MGLPNTRKMGFIEFSLGNQPDPASYTSGKYSLNVPFGDFWRNRTLRVEVSFDLAGAVGAGTEIDSSRLYRDDNINHGALVPVEQQTLCTDAQVVTGRNLFTGCLPTVPTVSV